MIPAREADERLVNSRGEAGDISVHEHVGLLPSGHRDVPMLQVWSHLDGGRKLINGTGARERIGPGKRSVSSTA